MEDHSLSSPELAVFDFDGTLTRRDSLPGFLLSACGLRAFVLRLPLIVVLKLAVLLHLLPAGRASPACSAPGPKKKYGRTCGPGTGCSS